MLIYRTFLSTELKTKCRDKKDYKRRNIVGLLQKLIKTYDVMADKYAGVYIDGMREPLAPVSHALQNAQIEITIDSNGCFIDAAAVPKKENRTLIPVSLKSANRTSHASPHPFAEQLEYLSGFDEERQKSYLEQLMDWDESAYGNAFTHAVHTYVEKNSIIHDLYKAEVLESENEEDMSKKKMQSTAYKKCLVRWKIKDVLTGEVIETWKSKEMFRCYIAYYNMVIAKESKTGLCMLTGENVPLTELHAKNIFPLQSGAKLVSANDKTEYTFRGTFVKNAEDLLTIGYEASQKSHNMLRWLLNNFGIIAGNEMFVYWNPNGRYVPSPFEDRKEGDEIISDRETLYRSIFESTEDNSLSSTDCIVIAAFKAMTTGRLSLAYYSETPGNDFVAKLEKWKESFTGAKWIPSIYMVSKYAYGSERNERIEIESGIYTKKIEELLWCKLYGHPISESLKNALVTKASSPLKYKSLKNRRYITYIAALILRKYENDKAGKEVYTMTLDLDNTEINYLMGRLLAVYEKAELDTYTEEELKSRIPNAVRYQNKYVQRPAATLIVLKNKIVPYLNKLKRKKNGLYIKYQKIFQEIFEKIDGRETKLTGKLSDTYILGYYHQKESFYQKQEADTEKSEAIAI